MPILYSHNALVLLLNLYYFRSVYVYYRRAKTLIMALQPVMVRIISISPYTVWFIYLFIYLFKTLLLCVNGFGLVCCAVRCVALFLLFVAWFVLYNYMAV